MEARSITYQDNGKSLVIRQTDRFSVYFGDATYPLSELTASPEGMRGYVSNGSIKGPRCYPIMFEATTEGRILLKNRGFHLEIVIDNKAPVSTYPLH